MTSEPCAKASGSLPPTLRIVTGRPAESSRPAARSRSGKAFGPTPRADDAAGRAAETEREGDLVVVHPRVAVGRRDELRVARVDLDEVAVRELHLVEPARRDRERPAPRDAGDRIGQLVEPAVVGRAPVAEREVRVELQLEARRSPRRRARRAARARPERSCAGRRRVSPEPCRPPAQPAAGAGDGGRPTTARPQHLVPGRLERRRRRARAPSRAAHAARR